MYINWFHQNRMKANSSKFQSIVLVNVSTDDTTNFSFNAGNADIPLSDNVKLLGVNIDNKLSFNEHITFICRRAAKQLNAMSRLRKVLTQENKMNSLNAFILSNLNYCPVVWHNCGLVCTRKIEKIQEQGLQICV